MMKHFHGLIAIVYVDKKIIYNYLKLFIIYLNIIIYIIINEVRIVDIGYA